MGALVAAIGGYLTGCDYGRSGKYRLSLQQQPAATGHNQIISDMQSVEQAVRAMLVARGYTERHRSGVWDKDGAHVSLERRMTGELTVSVSSFGGKASF